MNSEDHSHHSDAGGKHTGSSDSRTGSQQAHQRLLLVDRIDGILPQLQCGRCGYAGCRPYAQAVAAAAASCDLCAPGGEATAGRLREITGRAGEPIVLTAAASEHRDAAFAACRMMIDCLKSEVPFWKTGDWP